MPASPARGHFSLQILQETIRKMILVRSASRRFHPMLTAIGARVFERVFLRITAKRSPTCVTNSNCFFRRKTHDLYTSPKKQTAYVMHEHAKLVQMWRMK